MKIDNINSQANFNVEKLGKQPSASAGLKNILIALTALLGSSSYAGTEKAPSFSQDKDIATHTRTMDVSKEKFPESTFVVGASNDTINKDSLNLVIDSKVLEVKRKLEQEFLNKKFKEFSAVLGKELIAFRDNKLFSKDKTEQLSDKKLDEFIDKIPTAKDLMGLADICKEVITYVDDVVNKKEIKVGDKTVKPEKDPDVFFYSKLNDEKEALEKLNKQIETTKMNPNLFENIGDNAEVAKYATALDTLKATLTAQQKNLVILQKELEKQSNIYNDSLDKKVQLERNLKRQDIEYAPFKNIVVSDSTLLKEKHAIEKKVKELNTSISVLETSIAIITSKIAALENVDAPNKKNEILGIYAAYATTLNSYLAAVKSQYTELMIEKNKDIVAGIQLLQQEEDATAKSIESLLQEHKTVLANINQEKNKSTSDSINHVLLQYQEEETKLSKNIEIANGKLIDINIDLGFKFQQSYDIYVQRLSKELGKQIFYRNMFQDQIPGLEKEINDMNATIKKNIEDIKKLSLSKDIKDIDLCQRKVKENQTLVKNISSLKEDMKNKQKMANDIQTEIDNIDKVIQFMNNNKDLAQIAMKIYLSSKKIETNKLKFTNAKETKGIYDSLLAARKTELVRKMKQLTATDVSISNLKETESNNYITISNLLGTKDTLLLITNSLESDISLLNEKIASKNAQINILNLTINGWSEVYSDNQTQRDGLIYNRQSFPVEKNKYFSKEIVQPVESLLTTTPKKPAPKKK